ncbi:MAG: hypothetical protein JW727_01590 [Candidatus Aenigmarchaeota archaeon]|nr:hypothetical protein [Candidatus Aenigmarchaeota archaeon]
MATVSELVKKEAKLQKLASKETPQNIMGNIPFEKIKEIAKNREMPGNTLEAKIRQIVGTCMSYRITIDGKDPREFKHYGLKE